MAIERLNNHNEEAVVSSAIETISNHDAGLFGRIGSLETRLARNSREIDAAQSVRYKVFVEEMNASLPPEAMRLQRDIDAWDEICDHLLVLDTSIDGDPEDQIIGTYRLLRQEVAEKNIGFYSSGEFDIEALMARHPNKRFMELGRSCVLPNYRTKRTVELLWQGNWAYSVKHNMDVMIGCASFAGVHPESHALALSYIHQNFLVNDEWLARAQPHLYCNMDLMPSEAIRARKALAEMPPLVKGYMRLGAMFGDGAVVDRAFNTTDILVVLPVTSIGDRYINYYGGDAARTA